MVFFAGQKLTAADLNAAVPLGESQTPSATTFGSTSSTSYTATLTAAGTVTQAFVAPASGKISVTFTASILPGTAGAFGTISVGLSGAAGTVAPSDDWQAFVRSTDGSNAYHGTVERTHDFTGLVPGAAGVITMYHRASAGSVDFSNRQLKYRPIGV